MDSDDGQVDTQELDDFIDQGMKTTSADERQRLWRSASSLLEQEGNVIKALKTIKGLSRDKTGLDELIEPSLMSCLWKRALKNEDEVKDVEETREAQRCLNNLLLQSFKARTLTAESNYNDYSPLEDLVKKATSKNMYDGKLNNEEKREICEVNLKLLFLITALHPQSRKRVGVELKGLASFNSLFSSLLNSKSVFTMNYHEASVSCDALKVLFNLCLDAGDKEEEGELQILCKHIQLLMLAKTETKASKDDIITNCINLLTTMSNPECTAPLFDPSTLPSDIEAVMHEHQAMTVIDVLLDRLRSNLEEGKGAHHETMNPLLCTLSNLCRNHRLVRKYVKSQVLPPLTDMKNRPEEGDTIRNRLCKLLTSPVHAISCLVADFMFVLCKENVARMVKHTGYGNAAGLLARRGLMLGDRNKGDKDNDYSDDDDDEASDTEEYMLNAHKVNPIVGCVEPERPSPLAGMSDEQKEHEAMRLVGLINDLSNMGVVRPALPGPDGRPQQIDHILQLREACVNNDIKNDSDDAVDDERAGR